MEQQAEICAEYRLVLRRLLNALPKYGYRLSDEKQLCDGLAVALEREGVAFERERVMDGDRLDFLCAGGVAIEVKIKGTFAQALRQVERYCAQDEVRAVVIATTRFWADGRELKLRGKAVHCVRLRSRAF